jgi:two-component system, OmpR family, alkaline phosphatase synthesis response regulator PhoP
MAAARTAGAGTGDRAMPSAQEARTGAKILIVEDDVAIAFGLERNLRFEGYEVQVATDGERGLQMAIDGRPDLIILDIMLPRVSGYEICQTLRKNGIAIPVIFLSAKNREVDKVTGLDLGGDDYITKPFGLRELLARVKTILRRVREEPGVTKTFGDIEVDLSGQVVRKKGREVGLTAKEFELLKFLIHRPGKVLTRETILKQVWGFNYFGTARTIDNFINRLRQKIEDDIEDPKYILTVRGTGYKFGEGSGDGVEGGGG